MRLSTETFTLTQIYFDFQTGREYAYIKQVGKRGMTQINTALP
jgi:hypothetical protein